MKRNLQSVFLLTLFVLIPFSASLMGQPQPVISSVTVSTNPAGARFVVDGYLYTNTQTFLWPAGTNHNLSFPLTLLSTGATASYQESLDGGTRYAAASWSLSNGVTPTTGTSLTVVADPTITSIVLETSVSYKLSLKFSAFPVEAPGNCAVGSNPDDSLRPGVVIVGGTCYGSDTDVFVPSGSLAVLAYPFPGWTFSGWSTNGGAPVSYSGNLSVSGPTNLAALFVLATRVSFRTSPAGMTLLIDRTTTPTLPAFTGPVTPNTCPSNLSLGQSGTILLPGLCFGDFDFVPGSSHTIGGASPQYDSSGNMWVLESFSNGQLPNSVFVVPSNTSTPVVITGDFEPGIQAAFLTNPNGLKLTIDGTSNWLSYNFAWGTGTTHTVSAAASQTDSNGRLWTFQNWSNGGTATQTFTVNGLMRWTANYAVVPQAILQSNPSGITIQVDGSPCVTPCTLNRPAGSTANVTVPGTLPISDTSRFAFNGWSDGASSSRTVSFNTDHQTLTLNYQTQFLLAAAATPSAGASFSFTPSSPDGFFAQSSNVMVTAQVKPGYQFARWDGDLSGTYNQGTVMMTSPKSVMALLTKVPYVAPAGIGNAAGVTPDGTVAPGSLISISGESLAPTFLMGPTNPLAQAIGNDVVTVGGSLLPLVFIAPQDIRAQMLSSLTDGDYTLTVQVTGQPNVTGQFTVARNSPGLFPARVQDPSATIPAAWATHGDGTLINAASPAVQGESVTMYGTGFGPVNGATLDGFPASADMPLVDQLQIQAGSLTVEPDWAGLLAGKVGLMAVKFTVTPDFPTATTINVTVVVNGHTSNQVTLPLQ